MAEPHDLSARLAAIRRAYIAELPNKVADLNQAWNDAEASAWQSVQLQELHRLVHNLAGSGATFGFPVVSECARVLDGMLRILLRPEPEEDIEAVRKQLPDLYAALIAAVHSIADSP